MRCDFPLYDLHTFDDRMQAEMSPDQSILGDVKDYYYFLEVDVTWFRG